MFNSTCTHICHSLLFIPSCTSDLYMWTFCLKYNTSFNFLYKRLMDFLHQDVYFPLILKWYLSIEFININLQSFCEYMFSYWELSYWSMAATLKEIFLGLLLRFFSLYSSLCHFTIWFVWVQMSFYLYC